LRGEKRLPYTKNVRMPGLTPNTRTPYSAMASNWTSAIVPAKVTELSYFCNCI
jgi:hypothetical protein